MNWIEFVRMVYEMRQAQKDFFNKHTQSTLALAKDMERRVDREVLQILGAQVEAQQGVLDLIDAEKATEAGIG